MQHDSKKWNNSILCNKTILNRLKLILRVATSIKFEEWSRLYLISILKINYQYHWLTYQNWIILENKFSLLLKILFLIAAFIFQLRRWNSTVTSSQSPNKTGDEYRFLLSTISTTELPTRLILRWLIKIKIGAVHNINSG